VFATVASAALDVVEASALDASWALARLAESAAAHASKTANDRDR
jgi:hypothetical protein